MEFFTHYKDFIDADYYRNFRMRLLDDRGKVGVEALSNNVFDIVREYKRSLLVIIDEYDHFANDLIALGTNLSHQQYKELIWANGVVRDFYETLKDGTQTVVDKIFITGITPIMLDDVTSGFNISNNLSNDLRYSEMLGFTEDDVEFLIDECAIDRTKITIDRKFLYNGYLFHQDAQNKLYNPSMMMYILHKFNVAAGDVKELIDDNLKTDYGRIKQLLNNPDNVKDLEDIIAHTQVPAEVVNRFSIDKIHESKNFLSLLFYLGLVTIGKDKTSGAPLLMIPNYSTKTMYWEYMENIIMERNPEMIFRARTIHDDLQKMAFDGAYKPFFDSFQQNFVSHVSNRDLENFSEKNIKFLLLSIFIQSSFYLPFSELEISTGYSDVYLQRRNYLYPKIQSDWIWELKYVKETDAGNDALIEVKKKEAKEQLQRYKTSNHFKDRNDIRYLAVVFTGKKNYWIEEIEQT